MTKILCKLGYHKWGRMKQWQGSMQHKCKKCGKLKPAKYGKQYAARG